ncbi:hypothetical protein ACFRKE_12000 [Kitasatospora indigofera]|uniref:hypothetical protein n=1 Tax=Kitasatospora indigofera TaxID=67307 RepID=UPI0036CF6FBD
MLEEPPRHTRRGRPWAPPQGSSAEINQLAEMLRTLVDESGLTVGELQHRLLPEHFREGQPPSRATTARRLAAENLENDWEFVEAVIDVTSHEENEQRLRIGSARRLWERARRAPTPPEPAPQDGQPQDEQGAGPEAEFVANGGGVVLNDAVFNGGVTFTTHVQNRAAGTASQEQLVESQQQVIALMAELLDAQRQLRELKDQLYRSHTALDTVLRLVDEEPAGERLRRAVARARDQGVLPAGRSPRE